MEKINNIKIMEVNEARLTADMLQTIGYSEAHTVFMGINGTKTLWAVKTTNDAWSYACYMCNDGKIK
jgi:hypothetical protein